MLGISLRRLLWNSAMTPWQKKICRLSFDADADNHWK